MQQSLSFNLRRVKRLAERPKRTWISENPGKDECLRLRPGITELQYGYNQFYFRENPFDLFPDTSPLFRFTCKYIDSIDEDFQKPKQILRIKLSQEVVIQFTKLLLVQKIKWSVKRSPLMCSFQMLSLNACVECREFTSKYSGVPV